MTTLKGMYAHPDQVTIGSATSENNFLAWCQRQGVNMLNCYARSFLYTESNRAKIAAFVAKAKNSYGIIEVSVDVRATDNRELPGITAYFQKYTSTSSMINLLAEFEPYVLKYKIVNGVKVEDTKYDDKTLVGYAGKYAHFFYMLEAVSKLCKQYGASFDWYEGWIGNNYANPQEAVDAMVKYCDRIFISNYVSESDYNSTSTSLGKCDNRMDKRLAPIAVAAPKFGKVAKIIEILSLELKSWGASNDFLGNVFKTHSFYGSTYTATVDAYNKSTAAVLANTDLVGRTIFYSKYAMLARP